MKGITGFQRQNGQFSSTKRKTGTWPEKLMMRKPGRGSGRLLLLRAAEPGAPAGSMQHERSTASACLRHVSVTRVRSCTSVATAPVLPLQPVTDRWPRLHR